MLRSVGFLGEPLPLVGMQGLDCMLHPSQQRGTCCFTVDKRARDWLDAQETGT